MKPPVLAAAVLLWIATIVRLPMLRGSFNQRLLWVALLTIAVGLTLDVPRVAELFEHVPGLGVNTSHVVKHALPVIAAGLAREVVRAMALSPDVASRGRQRRALLTVAAVTSLAVLFVLAPVHHKAVGGLTTVADGEPFLLIYWTVYLLAVGSALVGIVATTHYARRTFPSGPVRTSMQVMGIGALIGLVYCGHKAFALTAATMTAGAWPTAETTEQIQTALVATTLMTVAAGVLWPSFRRSPIVRDVLAHRAFQQLEPLWRAYHAAEPSIALPTAEDTQQRLRFRYRDAERQLYRRIIEIRDGMLAVRPYAHPHSKELAHRETEREGCIEPDPIAEAAWLEAARRAKLRGDLPWEDDVLSAGGASDLAGERRLLTRIAKSYPQIQAIADRIDAANLTRTNTP